MYTNSVLDMVVSTTDITQKICPRWSATLRHKPGKMHMTWRPTWLSSNCESWSHCSFIYKIHSRLKHYAVEWASMCRLIFIPISISFSFQVRQQHEFMWCNFHQVPVQPGVLPDAGDFTDPAEGSDQPAAHWLHSLQVYDRPDSRILLVPPPADSITVMLQCALLYWKNQLTVWLSYTGGYHAVKFKFG